MAAKAQKQCVYCEAMMHVDKAQCPSCLSWQRNIVVRSLDETVLLSDVDDTNDIRMPTGPWDDAFGGGMLTGRVWMIGGAPGAGKSTLMTQISDAIATLTNRETLYIAAEENAKQIKTRAKRLGLKSPHLIRLLPMGTRMNIGEVLKQRKPCLAVIDSVSTLTADLDEQCRLAETMKSYATLLDIQIWLVAQISQEGDFAGKLKLQHAVDALFTFYADDAGIRTLFVEKNRDGQAQIKQAYAMRRKGEPLEGSLYPVLCESEQHNLYMCSCDQIID